MTTDAKPREEGRRPCPRTTITVTAVTPNKKWDWVVAVNDGAVPGGSGRCNNAENAIRNAIKAAPKVR